MGPGGGSPYPLAQPEIAQRFGAPAGPHAARSGHMAAAPTTRRKVLPLVAGVLVLVAAAGGGVWLALRSSGARLQLGASSRDELVKATFASIGSGDVAGLVARSGYPGRSRLIACPRGKERSAQEDKQQLDQLTAELQRLTTRARGASFRVGTIAARGEPALTSKGATLDAGCTAAAPYRTHTLEVELDIAHQDGTTEHQTATLTAVEIAGQWTMDRAPQISGCDTAVARFARIGAAATSEVTTIDGLQPILMKRCRRDAWSAEVVGCVARGESLSDTRTCLAKLPPEVQAALRKEVEAALAGAPSVAAKVRAFVPEEAAEAPPAAIAGGPAIDDSLVPDEPPDDDVDEAERGTPEPADVGDFWLWTRSDGAVRVSSPLAEIVFPQRPVVALDAPARGPDAAGGWRYTFQHELGGGGLLSFEISELARDASAPPGQEPLLDELAKLGTPRRRTRELGGVTTTDLEVADAASGMTVRVLAVRDRPRGVSMVARARTAGDSRLVGTRFLTSLAQLAPADPIANPQLLADLAVAKAGKKFVVHTAGDDLRVELPGKPAIERAAPSASSPGLTVSITAASKTGKVALRLTELAPWQALANTPARLAASAEELKAALEKQTGQPMKLGPTTIAGLPAFAVDPVGASRSKIQVRVVWNRFQRRSVTIQCSDVACDPIAATLRFAAPSPGPAAAPPAGP